MSQNGVAPVAGPIHEGGVQRTFLVRRELWSPDPGTAVVYRQGYLSADPLRTVRIRIRGDTGFLTVKGTTRGGSRLDYEYPIPISDAETMLKELCLRPIIRKTRYFVDFHEHAWQVDDFDGENAGLLLARVDFAGPGENPPMPPWIGEEVTGNPRYFNTNLTLHPYVVWVP